MHRIIALLVLVFTLGACSWNTPKDSPEFTDTFQKGEGKVSYTGYEPLKNKPVIIHYFIPEGSNMETMPILFVFPGTNRNANDYLNAWKTNAAYKKVMVFALEFPKEYYSSSQYIEGAMFTGGNLNAEANWTFSIIEPMFEFIKKETGSKAEAYDLWGHSAGAQFVHRLLIFKQNLHVRKAVSSNAGWYTVPDLSVEYPYGLKNSPVATTAGVQRAMQTNLIIHLGTADIDPNDSALNTTPGAMKQGAYRYARGLYFWNESIRIASDNAFSLKWTKKENPGVAHEFDKMADDAASLLY